MRPQDSASALTIRGVLAPLRQALSVRLNLALLLAVSIPLVVYAQAPTPGQNVNMVSGTKWPGGDPFLRQQNEPSIAVSTRNPQHLLAGANDYRTVDLPLVDQLPINQLNGDAWLGVFKSFDGGQRWQSTLLPGFPQDQSTFGKSSPMKGFGAASDPTVRAGTNGMFYYSGIALNRNTNIGGLFLARFIDLNNKENGDAAQSSYPGPTTDPIRYLNTVEIDAGNAGQFIDKPWIAVDIPRSGAGTCTIQAPQDNGTTITQSFPAGNLYIAYAMFVGGAINVRSKINFSKSSDCGATWTKHIMISQTFDINQGTQIAVDPETGYVYVAWRVFSGSGSDPDAIVITKSTDGGNTFTKAVPIRTLTVYTGSAGPAMFDQNTSATEFRDQTMPTLAVDDSGIAGVPGHVYAAWAERGVGPMGDARIQISTSSDGITWSTPRAVDNNTLTDDFGSSINGGRGHQLMPAMTFIGGKLLIVYYDLRLDHTLGVFTPNNPFAPDPSKGQFFEETRPYVGNSGALDIGDVFTPFIDDADPPLLYRRHTIDVMVAQVTPSNGVLGSFSTARLSRYDFGLPGSGDVSLGMEQLEQLKVNPPNLPMFAGGTVPFIGDYVDVAGLMYVPCAPVSSTCPAGWTFNNPTPSSAAAAIAPTKPPAGSPIYFGTWTTNQDVIPPADGKSWNVYTAPVPPGTISVFNGQPIPGMCTTGYEGDRNQNIYESRITQGLYVSSPQNSKPLSTTLQRAFVILVQNSTNSQKYFQLSIANQPPGSFNISGTTPGGYASFQQALPNQPLPLTLPTPVTTALATIPAHSGATRTVFVLSSSQTASITVNVNETDAGGNILGSGLSSFIVLNADGTVPSLIDPDETPGSNPTITGTEIYTPGITHPTITTPGITHQSVQTPGITHPGVETPGITHQGIPNQSVQAAVANTSLANSSIPGSSPLADATFSITNTGNTTGGYIVKLAGANSTVPVQLAVTQVYTTQTASNCALSPQQQDVTNVNVTTPGITHTDQFSTPGITHPAPTDATILLAPGDSAFITMRGQTDLATMANIVNQITPVVVPQAVNTNSTGSLPVIVGLPPALPGLNVTTTSLPQALIGSQYAAPLQASGGVGNVTWALTQGGLPTGLFLNGSTGLISGTPTAGAVATIFTVQATDSAAPTANVASRQLGLDIVAVALGGTVINVTTTADSGPGSLRQAITTANASSSSPVAITFNIPGGGVQTITPSSALPALTNATILDATTQPGYAGTPIIELNGSSAGASNGLHISAGNSTVRGLVINRFGGDGILLDTNGGDVIQGSYIGTDVTGTMALPNAGNGIQIIDIANNVVGGTATLPGNVISGNGGEGLRIDGALATGNLIQGNYIGTNASGSMAVGNTASGVYIRRAPSNSVIGNTVSGNTGFGGITICGDLIPAPGFCGGGDPIGSTQTNNASGNIVQGNLVGTNSAGTTALGNSQAGVSIDGAPNTLVGGTTTAMDNVISFNGTNDVQIFDTGATGNKIQANTIQGKTASTTVGISVDTSLTGNTLSQNSISGHGGLGIVGPSNYPVITSAQVAGGNTTITGTLNSTANATFTIEFFSNAACNASGNGEGATFLGSTTVRTDGSGNASFNAVVGPASGNVFTATATDASGTTSEFSACFPPPVVIGTLMPTQGVHKTHSIDVRGLTDWTLNGVHHNAQRQSIGSPISAFVGARICDISGRSSLRRTPMLPAGSNQRVG